MAASSAQTPHVTTELTSKNLKSQILISAFLFWGGLVWGIATADSEASGFAGLAMFIGLIWYIITKINIWWNHK